MPRDVEARGVPGATARTAILFMLLGVGLGAVGLRSGGPFVGGAFASFGVAVILGGLHSMVTRRHRTQVGGNRSYMVRLHSGTAAVLFGVAFLIPGVVLVVGGIIGALGGGPVLQEWLVARPGPVLMGAGLWACVGGLGRLISRWTYADVSTSWPERLPGQVVGVWVILMGVGLIALGWSLSVDPAGPRAAFTRFVEWAVVVLAGEGAP